MANEVWVFDVDGCLIDSLSGSSLRPGTSQLLTHLRRQGCTILLWSAGGADYAKLRMQPHGVDTLFHSFHDKDQRDADGRYIPTFLADPLAAVFVDDRPEDMPVGADVVTVSPYISCTPWDRGLARAAARAGFELTVCGITT